MELQGLTKLPTEIQFEILYNLFESNPNEQFWLMPYLVKINSGRTLGCWIHHICASTKYQYTYIYFYSTNRINKVEPSGRYRINVFLNCYEIVISQMNRMFPVNCCMNKCSGRCQLQHSSFVIEKSNEINPEYQINPNSGGMCAHSIF